MKMIEKSNVMGGIYETASTNPKSIVSVVMEGKGQIEYTGQQRKRSSRAISLIRRTNQEYQVCICMCVSPTFELPTVPKIA